MKELSSINEVVLSVIEECSLKKLLDQDLYHTLKKKSPPHLLIGIGKMAYPLISELKSSSLLGRPFVITKTQIFDQADRDASLKICIGSHPHLDFKSLQAGQELLSFLEESQKFGDHDMFVGLTGGASSLVDILPDGVSSEFIFKLNSELLKSGADIEDVNQIRQEFSCLKNGGLLTFSKASSVHTFITSDIPSGNFEKVGSSPTVYKAPDFSELKVLVKNLLSTQVGQKALSFLESKNRSLLLQKKEKAFKEKDVRTYLIADYKRLSKKIKLSFEDQVFVKEEPYACEIGKAVKEHIKQLKKILDEDLFKAGGGFYLTGGETPVLVKGKGLGGRNTEFVLRMAKELFFDNVLGLSEIVLKRVAVASFATDGTDGETSAAGAWFDYSSFSKAKLSGIELESYLKDNDSYNYFKKLGCLINIEKGEVNIMDLRIVLLKS